MSNALVVKKDELLIKVTDPALYYTALQSLPVVAESGWMALYADGLSDWYKDVSYEAKCVAKSVVPFSVLHVAYDAKSQSFVKDEKFFNFCTSDAPGQRARSLDMFLQGGRVCEFGVAFNRDIPYDKRDPNAWAVLKKHLPAFQQAGYMMQSGRILLVSRDLGNLIMQDAKLSLYGHSKELYLSLREDDFPQKQKLREWFIELITKQ